MKRLISALSLVAVALVASLASAEPCSGFTECCRDTCDPSCCYAASGFTDPSGCKSGGSSGEYCAYGGCTLYCGTCDIKCLNAKYDAGATLPDSKFDVVAEGGDTGAATDASSDASDGGPPSPDLPQLVTGEVCYVFVHGSLPLFDGPAPKHKPGFSYWGTGKVVDPEAPETNARGQFVDTLLTGRMAPPSGEWSPRSEPLGADKRWAAVTYNSTLTYYWAALDVLQQLEAIEKGRQPISMDVLEQENGVVEHAQGTSNCRPGDKLILIGHSMGGMVVSFLLQNMRPDDLNYEFLRTGGLTPNVPYYLDKPGPEPGEWIQSKRDDRARLWNRNKAGLGKRVLWGKPVGFVPVAGGVSDEAPGTERRCFYPKPGSFGAHDSTPVFPNKKSGVCLGDEGTQTPEQTLSKVAYAYMIESPLRGTAGAHCACQADPGADTPTVCQLSRKIGDCLAPESGEYTSLACRAIQAGYRFFNGGSELGFNTCNPALESMQSEAPYLLENLGAAPGRLMFLLAGTDPTFNHPLVRPMDCVQPGAEKYCPFLTHVALKTALRAVYPRPWPEAVDLPTHAPAMNDQAVPIASAMACRFDLFSEDAVISVGDNTLLASSDFRHAMCVGNEKIWPGWVRNDAVLAVDHTKGRLGIAPREAYAPTDSFWTRMNNPTTSSQKYQPGEGLVFGMVASPRDLPPGCFSLRMPKDQVNDALCKDDSIGRRAFMGCSPRCVMSSNGVAILRRNPTFGRILWVEENWRRGPG